ncbi:MAG: NAD-dependent malic enzyme [Planctomycetes bacterium]|nr:NAD-dependent malic enzyme [Planctomycetota bacterium]
MTIRRELLEHGGHLRTGTELLHDPKRNKGTAFSPAEREALGLRGLLPPHAFSEREQVQRALENIRRSADPLQRYIAMAALQDRNETLYFRVLLDNLTELMPIVYTPTVGQACQQFGHIFRRPRGLFVSVEDRGRIGEVLQNWPVRDVRVIVVTDGERILGLGDLGAHGMGIPVGKLNLYTACAGIDPRLCLPITLDVGTDNTALLDDLLYVGLRRPRLRGGDYDEFLDEFVTAVMRAYPRVLLQFEDFGNRHAFTLLARYRDRLCCFNDDIQGTAAVALAGILASLRVTGGSLADHRLLFLGAGEAGTGIADLITAELIASGMAADDARRHCWLVDSKGLVTACRQDLAPHKRPYAHGHAPVDSLLGAVRALRPTALIGVSGQPQAFTEPVVSTMAAMNDHPLVFALSNPTAKAECTARQAYTWSGGQAIFASGSPFDPVEFAGRTHVPGQGNNAYVFPGVGLGITASGASRVPDEMFRIAARVLAGMTSEADLMRGCLYPPLSDIRAVSLQIGAAVAEYAWDHDLTTQARPKDVLAHVRSFVYEPDYDSYVVGGD